jgi:hypothetical protein
MLGVSAAAIKSSVISADRAERGVCQGAFSRAARQRLEAKLAVQRPAPLGEDRIPAVKCLGRCGRVPIHTIMPHFSLSPRSRRGIFSPHTSRRIVVYTNALHPLHPTANPEIFRVSARYNERYTPLQGLHPATSVTSVTRRERCCRSTARRATTPMACCNACNACNRRNGV